MSKLKLCFSSSEAASHFLRGASVVFAGCMINIVLGAVYTFGNVMPYMASYMRNRTDTTIEYR